MPTACRALGVSQAWFYKWRHGDPSPRQARREQLMVEIRRLFAAHRGTYGSPRITADLRDAGWPVSENTVAAIMARAGLGRPRRRGVGKQTTRPGKGRWRAPDLIGRDFAAEQAQPQVVRRRHRDRHRRGQAVPGQRAGHGLAAHRRVRPRRAPRRRPGLRARWRWRSRSAAARTAVAGVHPAHRPGQRVHREHRSGPPASRLGITQSMGRAGSALDNAVIESWHSTLEFELRRLEHFTTKAQARRQGRRLDRGVQPRPPTLLARA